jgi:hypothetical protein
VPTVDISKWKNTASDDMTSESPKKKQKKAMTQSQNMNGYPGLQYLPEWPEGTHWSNNSCAYDAVITVLFNTWRENPPLHNITWSEINNDLISGLVYGFNKHVNGAALLQVGEQQPSLEEVCECM